MINTWPISTEYWPWPSTQFDRGCTVTFVCNECHASQALITPLVSHYPITVRLAIYNIILQTALHHGFHLEAPCEITSLQSQLVWLVSVCHLWNFLHKYVVCMRLDFTIQNECNGSMLSWNGISLIVYAVYCEINTILKLEIYISRRTKSFVFVCLFVPRIVHLDECIFLFQGRNLQFNCSVLLLFHHYFLIQSQVV